VSGRLERRKKIIEKRYRTDIGKLQAYWPVELITLEDIIEHGVSHVKLANGESHEIDDQQARRMADVIPDYLWSLVRLPLLFRYERDDSGRSWYVVLGGNWEKRAVELLLTGKMTSDGKERIGVAEFRRLLSNYQSLVFVSLGL